MSDGSVHITPAPPVHDPGGLARNVRFLSGMTLLLGVPLYLSFAFGGMTLLSAASWHLGVSIFYWICVGMFGVNSGCEMAVGPFIIAICVVVLTPTFHQAQQKYRQGEETRIQRLNPPPGRVKAE